MKKPLFFLLLIGFLFTSAAYSQHEIEIEKPTAKEHALSGWATAINENFMLVASPQRDQDDLMNVGAVTVYKKLFGRWQMAQTIKPQGLTPMSNFGMRLALDDVTALVSSTGDHVNGLFSGIVYIYEYTGGSWAQTAFLKGSDTGMGHRFGSSVDLYGNLALVGAYMAPGAEENSGAAYLFEKSGTDWVQTEKLAPDDGKAGDAFGKSIEIINPNTIAVGAYKASGDAIERGAVYIYERSESGWQLEVKLEIPGGGQTDMFGYALTTCDDLNHSRFGFNSQALFIGAPGSKTSNGNTGAVYVFTKFGDSWELQEELVANDLSNNSRFGTSIACNRTGDLYIGASKMHSDSHKEAGRVFSYKFGIMGNSFELSPTSVMISDTPGSYEHFGSAISAHDHYFLISSPNADRDGYFNSGNFRLFSSEPDTSNGGPGIITTYKLFQNYPNPFNPETVIRYQLPDEGQVRLDIYSLIGRRIATLINETVPSGIHEVTFDASNLASGVYVYRLTVADQVLNKRFTLIK